MCRIGDAAGCFSTPLPCVRNTDNAACIPHARPATRRPRIRPKDCGESGKAGAPQSSEKPKAAKRFFKFIPVIQAIGIGIRAESAPLFEAFQADKTKRTVRIVNKKSAHPSDLRPRRAPPVGVHHAEILLNHRGRQRLAGDVWCGLFHAKLCCRTRSVSHPNNLPKTDPASGNLLIFTPGGATIANPAGEGQT